MSPPSDDDPLLSRLAWLMIYLVGFTAIAAVVFWLVSHSLKGAL